MLLEFIRNY
jgi:hypothetical protein